MEPYQNPSSFSSLQQLTEELANLIALESGESGNPWVSTTRLTELFCERYGVSPEDVANVQGCGNGLRSLFVRSKQFVIYPTQIPQEFYIALFRVIFPDFPQFQATPVHYRIKRPWKVDGRLLRVLKAEGAKEISPPLARGICKYQPTLVPEIKSVDDLEIALMEIMKGLMINHGRESITIGELGKNFFDYYKQPIRTMMRRVCPEMKLVELLQTIPSLHIQKWDNDWHITIKPPT